MGDFVINVPDMSEPLYFILCVTLFFIVIVGRYLLIAGLFYAIYYCWFPRKLDTRKLSAKRYRRGQLRTEITWSTLTSIIFAVAGAGTVLLWQKGFTSIYTDIQQYSWWYLPVSLIAAMFFQETYYYWLHRAMHHPTIFRIVHKVHHDSQTTSPFTAFSFHPLEGVIQALALPLTLVLIPMHPFVILVNLTLMTFSSVINHLNLEIYPGVFYKNAIGRWIIGATHHAMHHKQYRYNFGLYFTFWDKFARTENPGYEQVVEDKSTKA